MYNYLYVQIVWVFPPLINITIILGVDGKTTGYIYAMAFWTSTVPSATLTSRNSWSTRVNSASPKMVAGSGFSMPWDSFRARVYVLV
jgi:hypothetical protein